MRDFPQSKALIRETRNQQPVHSNALRPEADIRDRLDWVDFRPTMSLSKEHVRKPVQVTELA